MAHQHLSLPPLPKKACGSSAGIVVFSVPGLKLPILLNYVMAQPSLKPAEIKLPIPLKSRGPSRMLSQCTVDIPASTSPEPPRAINVASIIMGFCSTWNVVLAIKMLRINV